MSLYRARILAATKKGGVYELDLAAGRLSRRLKSRGKKVTSIAMDGSGRFVALGSSSGKIRVLDIDSGRVTRELEGHTGPVRALAFDRTGRKIISGSEDGSMRLWDAISGESLVRVVSTKNGWAVVDR